MNRKIKIVLLCFSSIAFADDIQVALGPIIAQASRLGGEYIQDRSKPIPVVAIAGCSAVGKSYFTHQMAHALRERGFNVFVLHQDDYLDQNRTFPGFKIHPNLNHEWLHNFLSQNRSGIKKIIKPCVVDHKYIKNKQIDLTRTDIILFEGIYALTGPETYDFVNYCTLGVFLDAQTTDIITWHAMRNKKRPFFQRHGNSVIKEHATCLLYEYARFILPSRKNAHYVVYKEDLNSYKTIA